MKPGVKWMSEIKDNSKRSYLNGLGEFALFISRYQVKTSASGLFTDLSVWKQIDAEMVEKYIDYLVYEKGLKINTIYTQHLAPILKLTKIANLYGHIDDACFEDIKRARRRLMWEEDEINRSRRKNGVVNRKEGNTRLSRHNIDLMMSQPDTDQGIRNRVLIGIAFLCGLDAYEMNLLAWGDIDLSRQELTVYRRNTDKRIRVPIPSIVVKDLERYRKIIDDSPDSPVVVGSRKGGKLQSKAMSASRISTRMREIGEGVGIDDVTATDAKPFYAKSFQGKMSDYALADRLGIKMPETLWRLFAVG